MATLTIDLSDELYQNLKSSNIDIHSKIRAYLSDLVDDGYPSISTDEASKRVQDALKRYETNKSSYTPYDSDFADEMDRYIQSL